MPLKTGDTIPRVGALRSPEVRAGFSDDVQATLAADPSLVATIAERILERHFPESLHQDILDASRADTRDGHHAAEAGPGFPAGGC